MKRALFLFLITAVGIFGCAKSRKSQSQAATTNDYYAVKSASAAFFRYGPQQANGPDRKLARDTLLTISRKSFGYARVRLTSGEEGFVAIDDIRPAPANLIAKTVPTPTPTPAALNYPEPKLPSPETTPAVEPTAIAAPSP
ncbi:MAG: hypothetical protein QOG48_821 [Verrucomicrobiota bacterium]|jgi:hypothetical protein